MVAKKNKTIQVGVLIDSEELEEMRALSGVGQNSTAILSLARKGASMMRDVWCDWAARRTQNNGGGQ